ncbi:unnamed protein product [Lota lota]
MRDAGSRQKMTVGTRLPVSNVLLCLPQEEQHQREVVLLHRRLEDLESVQQHQMEELGPPAQRDQDISGQS